MPKRPLYLNEYGIPAPRAGGHGPRYKHQLYRDYVAYGEKTAKAAIAAGNAKDAGSYAATAVGFARAAGLLKSGTHAGHEGYKTQERQHGGYFGRKAVSRKGGGEVTVRSYTRSKPSR